MPEPNVYIYDNESQEMIVWRTLDERINTFISQKQEAKQ